MGGGGLTGVIPLHAGDPRQLSGYRLTGRLGEGGMGVVYLAEQPDGRPVAVKVIRTDLSTDPTYRRRFRSEVERARQVPPFCTAEVLDADPDHDPPYLVVEYVDGPSLASVIAARGPLTPANLHALAIGVATALTAIHGAGVIHRDLKASNVLLAPGSPKVIDFGIARPVHSTSSLTTASQVMGTVAYMAPERLGPTGSTPVTPAADIFAWGVVVAYAGTGRLPFSSGELAVVAAQILTQPPDLAGLDPTLHGPVEWALAKNPADRPTARALLDSLLTSGPRGGTDLAAAFAGQPALLVAAEGAAAIPVPTPAGAELDPAVAAARTVEVARPGRPVTKERPRLRRRWVRISLVALGLLALVSLFSAVSLGTGLINLTPAAAPSASSAPSPVASPSRAPTSAIPSGYVSALRDPLTAPGYWQTLSDPQFKVTCDFDSAGLVVVKSTPGTYRCPGPRDSRTDFVFSIEVTLVNPASCAGVWFRFTGARGGYALRACPDRYELVTHIDTTITVLRTIRFAQPVPAGGTIRVGLAAQGRTLRVYRDGAQLGEVADGTFDAGRLALGIFETEGTPPFQVT